MQGSGRSQRGCGAIEARLVRGGQLAAFTACQPEFPSTPKGCWALGLFHEMELDVVVAELSVGQRRCTGSYFKVLTCLFSIVSVITIRSGSENITVQEIDAATAQLCPYTSHSGPRGRSPRMRAYPVDPVSPAPAQASLAGTLA